ncbi:chorismate mutase|uniref:chorismate mutase n=1 Tax=Dendrosporobacter quercicolus TaxID=146817 RepID=A0A1G9MNF6_9FIRM|nr:chorismate mutase [Dendrosporobacter quercicolus DSM 1736]SDL75603.1 chorismate mutase [Dendrosporobacter quercicolus]
MLRGVRGAITVEANDHTIVCERVIELLTAIVAENNIATEDIGAVIFSSTSDLDAAFPAEGARKMGWQEVPLFGTQEIDRANGLAGCIRVLVLWNTDLPQARIKHIYLRDAAQLRQDIKK